MDPDGAADPASFVTKLVNLYNLQTQVDQIVLGVVKSGSQFLLSEDAIRGLHKIALNDLLEEAGSYRKIDVKLTGSPYVPPNWIDVPAHMGSLCRYVNENWDKKDLVHLASFCLWRLNWVHPFRNGNGRTARAVSYMVLCAKYGNLLPAKNSIGQQIVENKTPYDQNLRLADTVYAGTQNIDAALQGLEAYMTHILKEQIKANF